MRFEKFTNRLQQALSDAQSLAVGKDHTAIEGIHILSTLLEETSNLSLLQQAGANLPALQSKLKQALPRCEILHNSQGSAADTETKTTDESPADQGETKAVALK